MALPILDGNQTAATLSTVLTGGEHIPAHTVVSLGSQAITDVRSAVSGSVVSISNFPSTQTVAGTVTANVTGQVSVSNQPSEIIIKGYDFIDDEYEVLRTDQDGVLLVAPNGTIAVVGTVTANPTGTQAVAGTVTVSNQQTLISYSGQITATAGPAILARGEYSGTGWTTLQGIFTDMRENGVGIPIGLPSGVTSLGVSVGNSITIGSLPAISGTVTIGAVSTSVTVSQIQGTSVTTSNFTSTTASTTLVSANSARRGLTVFNEGAGNLHICAGATATTVAYQVRLSAGDYWECPAIQTSLTHSAQFASAGTARVVEIL